jgi:hypothetical protein
MSRARKKIVLDGIEYFIEAVTEAVTPKKKKGGRPKRKRGPKPKPKAVAKKPVAPKKPEEPLSKKDKAEIQRLSGVKLKDLKNKSPSEQREYLKAKSDIEPDPLPNRRKTGPEGFKPVEQGPLLSKVLLPEKMSTAQARRLLMQGKAKVVKDKNGKKKLVSTGEYAPARETIAEEMGLSGKGRLPTEADIEKMGGFEIKKHGGKVKRNMSGSINRGEEEASKAQRGKEKTKSAKVNAEIAKIEAAKANWMEGLTPKARKAWKQIRERDPVATAETTKRHARNKAKLEEMAEKKKQDFLADAKKFNKTSYIQGRPRATVRNIKARDVDKERTVRGVGAAKRGFGRATYSDKLY